MTKLIILQVGVCQCVRSYVEERFFFTVLNNPFKITNQVLWILQFDDHLRRIFYLVKMILKHIHTHTHLDGRVVGKEDV